MPVKYSSLLISLALGCAPLSTIGTYNRPTQICSRPNTASQRIQIVLEDELGHLDWLGNVEPAAQVCTHWDLPGARGRWGFVSQGIRDQLDTVWTPWFQGWALR